MILELLEDKATATAVFHYLFGRINKYEYRRIIGDRVRAKRIWEVVASKGYFLKNCKLFAYANYANRANGLATSPARYEIYADDVSFLRRLDLSHLPVNHKVYSLFDFDNLEGALLLDPAFSTWMGKFISRKLIFLTKSYGLKRDDIENQFNQVALFALRKAYPLYESELHATNICKTAIHNAGMGLIEYWTRNKRNALLNENGSFQAVHVQYDVLNDIGVMPEHEDEHRLNMQALRQLQSRLPDVDQSFLRVASGEYDLGFSFYIGKDNRDAVESMEYRRYLRLLCDYLGFNPERAEALFSGVRGALTP